jgi:hypothetical protein
LCARRRSPAAATSERLVAEAGGGRWTRHDHPQLVGAERLDTSITPGASVGQRSTSALWRGVPQPRPRLQEARSVATVRAVVGSVNHPGPSERVGSLLELERVQAGEQFRTGVAATSTAVVSRTRSERALRLPCVRCSSNRLIRRMPNGGRSGQVGRWFSGTRLVRRGSALGGERVVLREGRPGRRQRARPAKSPALTG